MTAVCWSVSLTCLITKLTSVIQRAGLSQRMLGVDGNELGRGRLYLRLSSVCQRLSDYLQTSWKQDGRQFRVEMKRHGMKKTAMN